MRTEIVDAGDLDVVARLVRHERHVLEEAPEGKGPAPDREGLSRRRRHGSLLMTVAGRRIHRLCT